MRDGESEWEIERVFSKKEEAEKLLEELKEEIYTGSVTVWEVDL